VSDADRDAEALILGLLRSERPDDAVLGEEGTSTSGTSGLRWIVDPLDGTVNFLYAQPNFAVSIACEDADGTLVGVVHEPLSGETFTAIRGGGASRDGVALAVNRPESLARALVATGFSYEPDRRARQGALLARLLPHTQMAPTMHHWRTHHGDEVDVVLEDRRGRIIAIEIKAGASVGRRRGGRCGLLGRGSAHRRHRVGLPARQDCARHPRLVVLPSLRRARRWRRR